MLRKLFRILSIVSTVTAGGCATGRPLLVETCVVDAPSNSLACTDKTRLQIVKPISQANDYICFPPADAKVLIERMHAK